MREIRARKTYGTKVNQLNGVLWGMFIFAMFLLTFAAGCKHRAAETGVVASKQALFKLLSPGRTHVDFSNTLTEGVNANILTYEYFYNGGGVAVGDLNCDGLQDIFFTGNMCGDKLYRNKGNFQFEDITQQAGLQDRTGAWKTGATIADVNGDGKPDIYICYSGFTPPDKRKNQLFINQGNDKNGMPHFIDQAEKYGLAAPGYSTQAYFFDMDRDGDLDMLLVNHAPEPLSVLDDATVKTKLKTADYEAGIRLYRNDNGHFHDVTKQSGLVNSVLSYGLAAGIADIDGDGWPDIYVSNDYAVPDYLYINNRNGTFTDKLQSKLGHTSLYAMGNDIADVNNDAKPDIFTLDMLPEDNHRQKILLGADNYESFNLNVRSGFYYQYMRNMLHLNNGNGTFSEIGQLAGISNTDWSWAPLFADYDNDGFKDLFVSNGFTRDFTNMDVLKYLGDNLRNKKLENRDLLAFVKQMPSSKVRSYLFKNNGNLTFANSSTAWGIDQSSNSNGAAYADLDNDGNLDLVVNNINQEAFIYQNRANKQTGNHYLSVALEGTGKNTQGLGAKVTVWIKNKKQYLEQMPTRGYQSTVSPILHFGLGKDTMVDSLCIIWQRGKTQLIKNIKADQLLTLRESNAVGSSRTKKTTPPKFAEIKSPIEYRGKKNAINDFKRQPLLTNPMSFSGPCMVKGDVNGDGLEDIYIGGGNGQAGALYIQHPGGSFTAKSEPAFEADKQSVDADAVFFDANGDGWPDLYISSGGYHNFTPDDLLLQDRLYLNDGKGNFTRSAGALPRMLSSKSCVRVADINGDGYPDLFVGGRVIPGRYPETPQSYLLINDGKGHFTDQTLQIAPQLQHIGMVTDAAWTDMNRDKKPDLVLVGEWMPITVLINAGGKLSNKSKEYFDKPYTGWWNKLLVEDINHDGHPDLIAGNLGLNSQCKASDRQPAEMYYKDFDGNGSMDPILCFYMQGKSYPYVTRDELLDQISMMRGRFPNYASYADATIDTIFTPEEMKESKHLRANYFKTACFESGAKGRLSEIPLPVEAQFSPIYTITTLDFDHDGKPDLLLCGNLNPARIRFGKYDANYGILLKGDGNGHYTYIPQSISGFHLSGDVRSVIQVNKILIFGISQNEIKAYREDKR